MKCNKCGKEVGIDIIQHIRTECPYKKPKKEKPTKQLSLWPKRRTNV